MRILTTDIFEGAYFLSQGMELRDVWLDHQYPRRLVMFEFTGDGIEVLKKQYHHGTARVNLLKLKASITEIKDRMFALLREKRLRTAPKRGQGGRYEIRRKGAPRAQAQELASRHLSGTRL